MTKLCLPALIVTLAFTAMTPPSRAGDFKYPSQLTLPQVKTWIDRCHADHPRLLTNKAQLTQLKDTVRTSPLATAVARAIVHQADLLQNVTPVERKLVGRRLLGQSRNCVQRVLTLAMAYHLTNDLKYARRAEKEMLAAAAFSDWNPSHFLDVAEMTFALAVGYDWLFDVLNDSSRAKIRDAIVRKGVSLPFTTRHKGWVRASNNWGQVCHGGLTAGALAVLEDNRDLAAKTVHNALTNVRYSMDAYAPNGSYPEGPGYWIYGTSYNVLLIGVLESALGTDFGLTKAPGFKLTGQFPVLACGPSDQYFNYSDGGASRSADPILFWFARRFDRPDWLIGEPERLSQVATSINRRRSGTSGSRLLPLVLLWLQPELPATDIKMPLHWQSEGSVPIAIHRSSWTDPNATFVGFKGGAPSANHGQMDIGSFVLDADGVRWAMDLGAEGYHGIEARGMNLWDRRQSSDRWTIFRQSNSGHNTLVIDGQLQKAAARAQFIGFSASADFPYSLLDMSPVYADQAKSVRRGIALLPTGEVLIQDELTGLKPGSVVRWGMITRAKVGKIGGGQAQLARSSATLSLHAVRPVDTPWQVVDTAKPRNEWDSPNRDTRMLALQCTAPASGKLRIAVLATPGSCSASATDQLKLRELDEWRGEREEERGKR